MWLHAPLSHLLIRICFLAMTYIFKADLLSQESVGNDVIIYAEGTWGNLRD